MKILDRIDNYILNETVVTIKASPKDKKEVERILSDLDVDYTDAGTYELDATFKSPKEAKKVLKKLPSIRYTMSEGKMQKGYWVSLHGRAGELDSAFVKDKKGIKSVLIDWASTLSDGDTIKIKKGESER